MPLAPAEQQRLAALSPQERADLLRFLRDLGGGAPGAPGVPPPVAIPPAAARRRRLLMIEFLVLCCVVLLPWIAFLGLSLPTSYVAQHWRVAWIGFDVALFGGLATTAWALWQRREVAIGAAIATATLLVCDAWFDTMFARVGADRRTSVVIAYLIELPLAALLSAMARRLMRRVRASGWPAPGRRGARTLSARASR
jgi:hypothetical protein